MADEAGIDFLLPIARCKGYGGETDYQGQHWNHDVGRRPAGFDEARDGYSERYTHRYSIRLWPQRKRSRPIISAKVALG